MAKLSEEGKYDKRFIQRHKDFNLRCTSFINSLKADPNCPVEAVQAAQDLLDEFLRQRQRFHLEPQPLPEGIKLGDLCRARVGKGKWRRAQLWGQAPAGHHVVFLFDGTTVLVERVKPITKSKKPSPTAEQDISQPVQQATTAPKAQPKRHDAAVANAQKRSWKEMQQKLKK